MKCRGFGGLRLACSRAENQNIVVLVLSQPLTKALPCHLFCGGDSGQCVLVSGLVRANSNDTATTHFVNCCDLCAVVIVGSVSCICRGHGRTWDPEECKSELAVWPPWEVWSRCPRDPPRHPALQSSVCLFLAFFAGHPWGAWDGWSTGTQRHQRPQGECACSGCRWGRGTRVVKTLLLRLPPGQRDMG